MRNNNTVALMLLAMIVLAGCATTDAVLFVTKTSLGIDFDSKPAAASIAYDRTEGYIAPRYDNGEIPPVVASIKSDAKIFNPKIRQIYATGDAAVIAVSRAAPNNQNEKNPSPKKLQGEKKLMFFGTSTTTGLKVGFTSYAPDSFVFGFKRKEYSFIPLGTQKDEQGNTYDVYPSVLASIDTDANAGRAIETGAPSGDTSLSNSQFFATGQAARELAAKPAIQKAFIAEAAKSLRAEQAEEGKKHDIAVKTEGQLITSIKGKFEKVKETNEITNEITIKATEIAKDEPDGYDPSNENITVKNFKKKLDQFNQKELEKLDGSINDNGEVISDN